MSRNTFFRIKLKKIFRLALCIFNLLFFVGFVNAQEHNELQPEKSKSTLVIEGGAILYSVDSKFNHQIIENKIIVSKNSVNRISFSKGLLVLSSKNIKSSNFNNRQKYSKVEKKTNKTNKTNKTKLQTTVHEKREVDFFKLSIKQYPSSHHFSINQKNNTDYLNQRTYREDYFNVHLIISYFSINLALNFLDKHKIVYNKSINFCNSQIFYTRPPPFKV